MERRIKGKLANPGSPRKMDIKTSVYIYSDLVLSIWFNGHFSGGPGLASTRMSPFRNVLELRMIETVVTTRAIKRAEFQSKCHQQTNTQLFRSQMPTNSIKALKGKCSDLVLANQYPSIHSWCVDIINAWVIIDIILKVWYFHHFIPVSQLCCLWTVMLELVCVV